ncbi:MAG: methyltransferase domain-containing protein [candidate division Zixibacteria bacterium]|nr:methyltransferase domain-containing protein [candidate division Zixibacteria bacterium]
MDSFKPNIETADFLDGYKTYFGAEYLTTGKSAQLTTERTRTEIDRLIKLLNLTGSERILDVGCGWGRHVLELARRGYDVTGIDQSETMIARANELARAEGLISAFVVQEMEDIDYIDAYDLGIALFGSFGYSRDDDVHLSILSRLHRALRDGGRLCIEQWNRDKYIRLDGQRQTHEHNGATIIEYHAFDHTTGRMNILRRYITAEDAREFKVSFRLFAVDELRNLLTSAGFERINIYGDLDGNPLTSETPRMVVVAGKDK